MVEPTAASRIPMRSGPNRGVPSTRRCPHEFAVMAALDFTRLTLPPFRLPLTRWRLPDLPPPTGVRRPLGTFRQGRPLVRAVTELVASSAVLLAAIAVFTLIQLHFAAG